MNAPVFPALAPSPEQQASSNRRGIGPSSSTDTAITFEP